MSVYLSFEKKIGELEEAYISAQQYDNPKLIEQTRDDLNKEISKTYKNLSRFQQLQIARHPDRPHAIDYIKFLFNDNYYEIHGDRHFRDDKAIICCLGRINGKKLLIIAEEKGRNTKEKIYRNFGMPEPEGYRKALRAAKLAEKFSIPILTLIDTPGAYPGLGAEERNQSEAIARNLMEFSRLKTPIISLIIGEGGSGGALAIGVGDVFAMMSYSVYSVISPEGCAAILWNDGEKSKNATDAMKILADDLYKLKLIDHVVKEPKEGAHRNYKDTFDSVQEYLLTNLEVLLTKPLDKLLEDRYSKLVSFGDFKVKK